MKTTKLNQDVRTGQDAFAALPGCACVKRAMEVAAAGGHSITIVDCNGYEESYLKAFYAIFGKVIRVVKSCPCGNLAHLERPCTCTATKIRNYRQTVKFKKALGADVVVESGCIRARDFDTRGNESAAGVLKRIKAAAKATPVLTTDARTLLDRAYSALRMNADEHDRAVRVAATIAGLDQSEEIESRHIAEAVQYVNTTTMRGF